MEFGDSAFYAEWPKVADAVIDARNLYYSMTRTHHPCLGSPLAVVSRAEMVVSWMVACSPQVRTLAMSARPRVSDQRTRSLLPVAAGGCCHVSLLFSVLAYAAL